jgi:hypothetical protein
MKVHLCKSILATTSTKADLIEIGTTTFSKGEMVTKAAFILAAAGQI